MADVSDQNYPVGDVVGARPNWGAIWSGTFTFIAIWAIFGILGAAVFASTANPSASASTGMNIGMAIWAVVLTIIAMFVAGRVTGQLAGPANSTRMHSTVMFGLSVTAALLIMVIGGNTIGNTRALDAASPSYLLGVITDLGWPLFIAMFLGWLAAMGGASSAHKELSHRVLRHEHQPSHA